MNFDHILNWELKKGSHDFPGPDGGTCINEAAIVAAGFEYRAISSASNCPPCFSRVIAAYAIGLNDNMPDALRQELLIPFVTQLAGTADTQEIEQLRAKHIALATINRILPIVFEQVGLNKEALVCRNAKTLEEGKLAAWAAAGWAAAAAAGAAARAAARAAAEAATAADKRQIFAITTEILSEAINLGNHQPIELPLAIERLERSKTNA